MIRRFLLSCIVVLSFIIIIPVRFVTVERLCDVMGIDRMRSSRQDELERAIGVCTSLQHGRADSYMKRLHFGYSYLHGL